MSHLKKYDVVILGRGPAGLQAAIHAARRKVSVLVLGKEESSSLFGAHVENFCCMFNMTGEEMLRTGRKQAAGFGADFMDADVLHIAAQEIGFHLHLESGDHLDCLGLILATGTSRNRLGVSGEKDLLGKGVSYCVECDCNFYKGVPVAVVGSGSAAADGALTMLSYASEVHLICESLTVAAPLQEKVAGSDVILHEGHKTRAIRGQNQVSALELDDGTVLDVQGVFIELGAKGALDLAMTMGVRLDDDMRFIQTDKKQATNLPGMFAAGDICGPPWQMAKAVGEGCIAGLGAADFAKKNRA